MGPIMCIYLVEELQEYIKKIAKRTKRSVSYTIAQIIKQYKEKNK